MAKRPKADMSALAIPKGQAHHVAPAAAAPAAGGEGGSKALTLRLGMADYRRLKLFAAQNLVTHQDILEAALREYLDRRAT